MTVRETGLPRPEGPYPPTEAMLAEPVPEDVAKAQAERLRAAWAPPTGWRYWTAVNNTKVGKWYCLTATPTPISFSHGLPTWST